MRLIACALLVAQSYAFGRLNAELGLEAVPLFMRPAVSTGRLVVSEEGLAVLRAQREPFAIISAMGPTRTGKSATIGRAFLRGANENVFEVGTGVTSYTSGVWITSKPIEVDTGSGTLRVLLIDSEGMLTYHTGWRAQTGTHARPILSVGL